MRSLQIRKVNMGDGQSQKCAFFHDFHGFCRKLHTNCTWKDKAFFGKMRPAFR